MIQKLLARRLADSVQYGQWIRRKPISNTFYFFLGFNIALSMSITAFAAYVAFH